MYLEPDGPIFNALIEAITHPISLQHALNSSSRNYSEAIETIGNAMKDIVSKITQFMVKSFLYHCDAVLITCDVYLAERWYPWHDENFSYINLSSKWKSIS